VIDQSLTSQPDARAYRLLQAELVAARNLFDRQVRQLTRLNALGLETTRRTDPRPVAETFAEAVVEVLDTGLGAVWVLDPTEASSSSFHVVGAVVPEPGWAGAAAAVASLAPGRRAVAVRDLPPGLLRGVDLYDVMVCPAVDRSGQVVAVLLSAHTSATAGMDDPPGAETLEVLELLAERCAAQVDTSRDWRVISDQVALLAGSEQRLERVLRGTNDGWWDWDPRGGRCTLSARWLEMLGHPDPRTTTVEGFWHTSVHGEDAPAFLDQLDAALARGPDSLSTELRLRRVDGTFLPVLVRGTVTRDESGAVTRFAGSILDLSERKRFEEYVERLAYIDPLTDLPNRRLLLDRLAESLRRASATGVRCGLLMVDLDRLKVLNDERGHAAGDELLQEVARRLRESVRTNDTVARLGGDEFVILLDGLPTSESHSWELARGVAAKVLEAVDAPYVMSGGVHRSSASIGVVVSPSAPTTPEALLHRADLAMYEAKAGGRDRVEVYARDLESRAGRRVGIEERLRREFDEDLLSIGYRAVRDIDGALIGVDAALRWASGEELTVADHSAVAGRSELIAALGRWAVRAVATEIGGCDSTLPAGVRVSVRVPTHHVMHLRFLDGITHALEDVGCGLDRVRVLVLADTVAELRGTLAERMEELTARGLAFSLLGFGTGACSLQDLQLLPVDEVRVSAGLLLGEGSRSVTVARAVLDLCSQLGIRVVAEGITDGAQRDRATAEGVRVLVGDDTAPMADSILALLGADDLAPTVARPGGRA
jgi:diguanylate cyclase (GGDEF)-like protein/PAS domain S-box-containing protein